MEAFEIVRLLGACIALILGAIVFMVLFFRGMSWIDRWIKMRNETDLSRPQGRRSKRSKRPRTSEWDSLVKERPPSISQEPKEFPVKKPIPKNWDQTSERIVSKHSVNGRAHALVSESPPAESSITPASFNPASITPASITPAPTTLLSETAALSDEKECVSKSVSRIATVHLLSGETIERVAFCSKDKASKICDGLGFEGIVFENDEGQICVVRENNLKMVTWKVGSQ